MSIEYGAVLASWPLSESFVIHIVSQKKSFVITIRLSIFLTLARACDKRFSADHDAMLSLLIQTEAERRRREAGVKQSMEIRLGSCMWVGGWVGGCVGMYGIWNYLANQST